jgi:hypothetical protein
MSLPHGYKSHKSPRPSLAGAEVISIEPNDRRFRSAGAVRGVRPGQARHFFLTIRPKRLHSCHIIIVGSYL